MDDDDARTQRIDRLPSAPPLPPVPPPPGPPASATPTVNVARWPSEIPLLVFVALAAFWIWAALAVSIFGLVYVLFIGLFFFFAHVAFVTYVRGSAVRLSERQFPELHARVLELSRRAGLAAPPAAYLMQAGGSLNALATKFFRARMIVLFTDLLDACGDDEAARDLVIGHEIGHLKSRHLDFHALLLPGMLVPFLGSAYSRARELTCDRWGLALCGDPAGAARGFAILAAGGRLGPKVDLAAYIDQKRDLDTGWLTIGRWLAPYPPLSKRIELIRPDVAVPAFVSNRGTVRAAVILAGFGLLPLAGMSWGFWKMATAMREIAALRSGLSAAGPNAASATSDLSAEEVSEGRFKVASDFESFEAVIREEWAEKKVLPDDEDALLDLWGRRRPGSVFPTDPFADAPYGVLADEGSVLVYSAGPDGEQATDDDIDRWIEPSATTGG